MNDQYSFNNIDSLLLQFALQTRELSQKKNEINQQIEVCRADIAEWRSSNETIQRNIQTLENQISVKQSTLVHNKVCAQSIKETNNRLLQYEQTLKEELESRKATYNHDKQAHEERIASYKKTFQSHKDCYFQNVLAQKLLALQAEKEEIESRIKACDEQITIKQKELDSFSCPAQISSCNEILSDSVPGQQPVTEPEKPLDSPTEEDNDSSLDISSLHLNQTKILENGRKSSVDANADDLCETKQVKDQTECAEFPVQEKEDTTDVTPCLELDEHRWTDMMHTEEEQQLAGQEDQEHQSTLSDREEAVEEVDMEEGTAKENDETLSKEGLADFSQDTYSQASQASATAAPLTPTFLFNFSPAGSPHRGSSDTKSPAFLFSLNPDPSTTGFSGFGFDVGSMQDEDSSFAFGSSFFNKKKTPESKSSGSSEFLFGQPEPSEDFKFAFASKSPQTSKKDTSEGDFPFSFNF